MGRRRSLEAFTYDRADARRARHRSIPSACCCSTSTTRTTAGRWSRRPTRRPTKWSLKWMVWLQDLMLTWGSSFSAFVDGHRNACRRAPASGGGRVAHARFCSRGRWRCRSAACSADHLGASLAADAAAAGVNYDWWNEFLGAGRGDRTDVRAGDPRLRRGPEEHQRDRRRTAAADGDCLG